MYVYISLISAVNLLNWSYQSANSCRVVVGVNQEVFPKTSAEANRTSSRPRPSSGGKYQQAAANSVLSTPSSQFSKLDPLHLRWRRSVNQHAFSPLNVVDTRGENSEISDVDVDVDDVDVAVHVDKSVHENPLNSSVDVPTVEERTDVPSSHQHVNVSVLLDVSASNTNESSESVNVAEEPFEDEGSGFIPARRHIAQLHDSSSELIQRDYPPVYSYGQHEVEIIKLNHESVTLKTGGNGLPQHTSPDANKLNNEVHDLPSFEGEIIDEDDVGGFEDITDRSEHERDTTGKSVITTTYQAAFQSDDATTMQYKDESKVEASFHLHTSLEKPSKSNTLAVDEENSAVEHGPQLTSEHVNVVSSEHGSNLTLHTEHQSVSNNLTVMPNNIVNVSTSDTTLTALPKVNVLELTPDTNGSSKHAKRVLVNVTIATDDASPGNETGHHPLYVLSVAVPTDIENTKVSGIDISPPSQKVASVLLGLSNENDTQTLIPKHEESPPPPQPQTVTTTTLSPTTVQYHLWGGVCECSCPCLDEDNNENDLEDNTKENESTDMPIIAENFTVVTSPKGNVSAELKQIDVKVILPENVTGVEEFNITSEILESVMNESSTIDMDPSTTLPPEMFETTTEEQITMSATTIPPPSRVTENEDEKSPPSTAVENGSSIAVVDEVTEVPTDLTSTETSRKDCPVVPTVTPPPPLILVLEGKVTLIEESQPLIINIK